MSTKPRVVRQCLDIIHDYKSVNRNKVLVHLSRKFDVYKKELRALIEALEEQHDAIFKLNRAKIKVTKCLSYLCDESPIAELVGKAEVSQDVLEPTKSLTESAMKKITTSYSDKKSADGGHSSSSYLLAHRHVYAQRKLYLDFLDEFIIDYLKKIEQVEVERVQKALTQSEILRRELDHYFFKVPAIEKQYKRSKESNENLGQCLKRNEKKLKLAKKAYDDHTQDLCLLLEEITERGWRDLFPIIVKLTQSDLFNTSFEYETMSELNTVVDKLKLIGEKYHVKMDCRVRELKLSTPIELSTRHLNIRDSTDVVDQKKVEFSDDTDEWEDESFVREALEATRRAELYDTVLQSNDRSEYQDPKESEIIVSPITISIEEDEGETVTVESADEGSEFVDVDIHLAPAPTEG